MATFVLVHGSYQGGWIWRLVANRLRTAGHLVYAPTLDGCAERKGTLRPGIDTETHANEIAGSLFYDDLDAVTLVGTSSGGMVVCRAAELARERICRLVFIDALALFDGERLGDIVKLPANASDDGLTIGPSFDDAANRLFADLPPQIRGWALERYTQHPIGVHEQPVSLNSFWSESWAADVIWCRRAQNPGKAHQRRTAEWLNGNWAELDTGHYPMLSMPDELTQLLLAGENKSAGRRSTGVPRVIPSAEASAARLTL